LHGRADKAQASVRRVRGAEISRGREKGKRKASGAIKGRTESSPKKYRTKSNMRIGSFR